MRKLMGFGAFDTTKVSTVITASFVFNPSVLYLYYLQTFVDRTL